MPRAALIGAVLACATVLLQARDDAEHPDANQITCIGTTTAADVASGEDLSGKVAIVTGGDGGLGYPVVRALAGQGATVIIASRNLTKCEAVAREVAASTGSTVRGMQLDLASLASVRAFVEVFLVFETRLDILINNAGMAANPQFKSKDGFQMLFAVNYVGPFLLTELLLPTLRQTGTASSPARVVNVASSEHAIACEAAGLEKGCLKDWTYFPPPLVPDKNVTIHYDDGLVVTRSVELYGFSKFFAIQHAAALSLREGSTLNAFSLTPGWVNTSMGVYPGIDPIQVKEKCNQQRPDPCPYTPEEGAAITAFCALRSTENGRYYSRIKKCQADVVESNGFTASMLAELYNRTFALVTPSDEVLPSFVV